MMTTELPAPLRLSMTQMQQAAELCGKSARLAVTQPSPAVAQELAALGRATLDRFTAMQGDWATQWRDWAAYAASVNQARTPSIYVEHSMNTLVRAQKLMSDQMTATMALTENVTVSYGYWLDRRIGGG
jgi:hypothetical protein